jgi:hypothetical protein
MSDVIQYDIVTKITTERAFTDAEKKAYESEQLLAAKEAKAEVAKAAARQVIFDRLGLTADEATLLLGGN